MTYTITLDREACDGVFACLVRDDRFSEAEDGLATLDGAERDGTTERVTVDDDRLADAARAAAACPVDAISVEER